MGDLISTTAWTAPQRPAKNHFTYEVDGQRYDLFSVFASSAPHWIAEEAGEDFYSNHDGWECSWPMEFTIFEHDVSIGRFNVSVEFEPRFDAEQLKAAA